MDNRASTLKQRAHELIDHLPESATWDDVIEEARFRKAVEEGLEEADRGEFATEEEVRQAFARWTGKA